MTANTKSSLLLALGLVLPGIVGRVGIARADTPRPVLAVFSIEAKGVRASRAARERLSSYLAARVAASGAYQVVPRDQIRQRLGQERRASYRDCYDQSCQLEIGKELAASKSLAAQLMRLGRGCVLTLTLYDLRTAATERGATARGACSEDALVTLVDRAVAELTGRTVAVPPAPPPAARPAGPIIAPAPHGGVAAPESLSRSQIQTAMRGAARRVQACYDRHRVPGTVAVRLTIQPHGMVAAADVVGSFARTPTGACVAAAVRQVVFPPFAGAPVTITYPYVLR